MDHFYSYVLVTLRILRRGRRQAEDLESQVYGLLEAVTAGMCRCWRDQLTFPWLLMLG